MYRYINDIFKYNNEYQLWLIFVNWLNFTAVTLNIKIA